MRSVEVPSSVIAINQGNGQFEITKLPPQSQLSCICGIACADINNDGNLDLVMGGNNFEFKPQYSRLDASYGNVLINKGDMQFEWQSYDKSGFFVKEEIKHLDLMRDKNGNTFIISAINNAEPRVFKVNE